MAKKGEQYERFVYDKFRRLFVDSAVTLNDKIKGRESGLEREIDISIRTFIGDIEVLYIVQCKDRAKRPADIVILGEFSSVIKDIGANRGFLICTSGFARSNHQYARTLGIELFTVEDIKSDRWKADVQIPLVYVKKHVNYHLDAAILPNAELVEKNRDRPLTINFDASSLVTFDNCATTMSIRDYIVDLLKEPGTVVHDGVALDLLRPDLQVDIANVWVECARLAVTLTVGKKIYLKYLTPDEYSHIRDHVRETTLPLHVVIQGTFPIFDDSFVEVPGNEAPIFPGLFAEFVEWTDQGLAERLGSP